MTSPPTRLSRLTMAALGLCAIAVALGTANALGDATEAWWRTPGLVRQAVGAVTCVLIATAAIVLLQRHLNQQPLRRLGLNSPKTAALRFVTGVGVCATTAGIAAGLATAAGWLSWGAFSLPVFGGFLISNALIAFCLEAFPEELAIRGYVWNSLRSGGNATVSFLMTTVAFLCVVPLSGVFASVATALMTGSFDSLYLVPRGEHPGQYLFLLTCFGIVLLIARIVTDSLWTGIGFHLTFLTVNRTLFFGEERGTGWDITVNNPDALIVVPGYLALSAIVLLAIRPLMPERDRMC